MSGRSNMLLKAKELGFKLTPDTPELKPILTRIKELESQGYEFEAAEASLALLIQQASEASANCRSWSNAITCQCAATA